ncbi:MAG TPA: ATP-binding protein, partial [Dissulfurispiraceae bacterium]|nr:ATP-binding protein [Dissulfurispiraceae bacterium]
GFSATIAAGEEGVSGRLIVNSTDEIGRLAADINMVLDSYSHSISERRKLQQQLFQAQKMEAVGQLAGGIAHDFNNILTAIIGFASLLQARINGDERMHDYVKQILHGADKASEVTRSLLAFSRKQMLNPKPVNLNDVVRGIEKLLSRLIREDIEITTTLSGKQVVCMADTGQIEHVLMNLTTNARDAMPKGGKLYFRTDVAEIDENFIRAYGYGESGEYAILSVTDTGSGMDQDTRVKIFEPFFTTKEPGKGTGLGLAMVYGIVKQHEGYINVYSEPGQGTTFKIYLPLCRSGEDKSSGSVPECVPKGGAETILIAEDDEKIRELLEIVLTQVGYRVIAAVDGEDAVNEFVRHEKEIQLLIIDMVMPGKSGKEVYDEITAIRSNANILFMSGYSGDHIAGLIDAHAGRCFINKPVTPKELLKKVREMLDSRVNS